jgi:hypothetical protein
MITGIAGFENPNLVTGPFSALQLPTYPIAPPPVSEALGIISWDLPRIIRYIPNTEVETVVEAYNPTTEQGLYAISYYFLNSEGIVLDEGLLTFVADSQEFHAFYLAPQTPVPAHTLVKFSSPQADSLFGLRLLLLVMLDGTAQVIQETSRVEVLLASEETYSQIESGELFQGLLMLLMLTMMGAIITQSIGGV